MTDKTELRGRIRRSEKTTVARTISFGTEEIREALALLGKGFAAPEGAALTIQATRAETPEDGNILDEDGNALAISLDFAFDWTEDAKPKREPPKP